ncbi:MAG TPA: hypothetical protein VMH22_08250 [bacterium]|nr:hypothetical protein [bacterium]
MSAMRIGVLLLLLAFSLAAAWGRKPPKEEAVNMRQLSTSEVTDILSKFPVMAASYLTPHRDEMDSLARLDGFIEMTAAPLKRTFPAARFFQEQVRKDPPYFYLWAFAGDKRYMLFWDFNRLLLDNGLQVSDDSIVELAEAFVVLSLGTEMRSFPGITFLGATMTKQMTNGEPHNAILRVRIGERDEEWYFNV